jgi:flavin reductase (DIM6/NTAB) family NADH-FMN oxidoreductase RutF
MVAISISPKRYSYRIIEKSGEFVVNVPTMKLAKKSLFCGRTSGTKVDKFKETKLTPMPAKKVKPPLIKECVAHLECKLVQKITTGDHTLFVGEVLAAYVNKGVFIETFNSEKVKPLFHMGGDDFVTISPEVVTPRRPRKAKN